MLQFNNLQFHENPRSFSISNNFPIASSNDEGQTNLGLWMQKKTPGMTTALGICHSFHKSPTTLCPLKD
ncbi:hypothetical protein WN944_029655 [Citrus x changshan-huyou]|uniref:Uncharacterized protein n=1 Tax=Citrus x changshan-huyou TaxID=2935761 RepID=A0AAP0LJD6_9ROSI